MVVWKLDYHLKTGNLKTGPVKSHFSDVSIIQIPIVVGFRIVESKFEFSSPGVDFIKRARSKAMSFIMKVSLAMTHWSLSQDHAKQTKNLRAGLIISIYYVTGHRPGSNPANNPALNFFMAGPRMCIVTGGTLAGCLLGGIFFRFRAGIPSGHGW